MSDNAIDTNRRNVLRMAAAGAVAVPLGSLLLHGTAHSSELPHLSEDDPIAQGLSYVHDASTAPAGKRKDGTYCKNCNLIQAQEGEWRPCAIIPGKAVNENGWCAAWVGRV
jgi:hypothetical protein